MGAAVFCAASAVAALPASGQYRMDKPLDGPMVAAKNPVIESRPNAQIPFDLTFTRSDGTKVTLEQLFNQKRPVILQMVYFSCPQMCGMNQDHLAGAVKAGPRDLSLGRDYDVLIVSIDSEDTSELAATKRANYLTLMNRAPSQSGFTYLTGTDANIRKLADVIGFGFSRNPPGGTDKFAHSLGTFIVTPYGRVSRTIGDIAYTPDELHAALLVAADNRIGTNTLDRFFMSCGAVRLNPNTGKYEHNPWFWAGTAGGLASIAFTGIFLGVLWRGEYRKHKQNRIDGGAPAPAPGAAP